MNLLQAWVTVGIPGFVVVFGFFVGRSQVRAYMGYAALAVLFTFFLFVEGGVYSAMIVGAVAVGYLATGRGFASGGPEHHEQRDAFTRV